MSKDTVPFAKAQQVDVLAVLDIDRTLLDSPALEEALIEFAVKHYNLQRHAFQEDKQEAEKVGSFDEVGWIAQAVGPEFEAFKRQFFAAHRHMDFVFPDAHGLLDALEGWQIPVVMMTHGSEVGQRTKIEASDRLGTYDYIIIDAPNKGERLQTAYDPVAKHFALASDQRNLWHAQKIILADDKARNFAGLPAGAPVLGLHLAGRARSGNQAALDFKPHILPVDQQLDAAPPLIAEWLKIAS